MPAADPHVAPRTPRALLIATRKGLWTLASDPSRRSWKLAGPQFLGHIVHHAVADPRDGKTLLAAARTGHLGPTIFRSTDRGRTWKEAQAAARVQARQRAHRRSHVLADARARVAAGRVVRAARRRRACSARTTAARRGQASTASTSIRSARRGAAATRTARRTARSCTRSSSIRAILRTCIIAMSSGGVFESTIGRRGLAAAQPGRARRFPARARSRVRPRSALRALRRAATRIASISRTIAASIASTGRRRAGPTSAAACRSRWATIGLPMVVHPHDPDTLWVFPMDGTDVWPRVSPGGRAGGVSLARRRQDVAAAGRRASRRRRRGGRSSGRR